MRRSLRSEKETSEPALPSRLTHVFCDTGNRTGEACYPVGNILVSSSNEVVQIQAVKNSGLLLRKSDVVHACRSWKARDLFVKFIFFPKTIQGTRTSPGPTKKGNEFCQQKTIQQIYAIFTPQAKNPLRTWKWDFEVRFTYCSIHSFGRPVSDKTEILESFRLCVFKFPEGFNKNEKW